MNVYTPLEITVGEHYNTAYSMAIDSPILALLWSLEIVVLAFSSLAKDFGRTVDRLVPACAFFFFFEVEISSRTRIPLFIPESVHNGSAS